jgi:hypothetical protein
MDTKADNGKEGRATTERVLKDNHGNNSERAGDMQRQLPRETGFKLDCSQIK